ncbi:hypothetical protein ACJIZ3_014189 [Penstemon smallii]|uniref:Bidirectional sugar transporter SWEET n=1 Tax=Penstemon smallii TaxID=265156 RepID=A0ABD3RQH1_9LAMI
MEDLSFLVGVLGNIATSIVYLSPSGTFYRIVKNKSTEEFDSLPYICMLLNSLLWTYYGMIKPNGLLLVTVNGFGSIVLAIFIFLYLIFAPPKMKAKTAVMAAILDVGVMVSAIFITRLGMERKTQINFIGFLSTFFTIISYGSPLAAMRTVVTTKSVEYMPFFLTFFLCINGIIWTVWAVLVRDYFVGVPNGTGVVLGALQLVIYAIYRNAKPLKSAIDILEEGCIHEQLIPN